MEEVDPKDEAGDSKKLYVGKAAHSYVTAHQDCISTDSWGQIFSF